LSNGFGITKFHHHFRTKEQREAILDWMAKRRLNLTAAVLMPQIERVMAVPGVNPYTEWFIKQHQINDLYASNELFEQLHWYYGPWMKIYLRELEARADRGDTKLEWADIQAECDVIQQRWLGESIAAPVSEWFQGGTIEAVEAAWQAFGDFRPVTGLTSGSGSASLR